MAVYFKNVYFGRLVRQARGDRSLRDIAELTNVSASTLSRIENGIANVDMQTLIAVCSWLDISPGSLFTNTQNPVPDVKAEITSLILGDKRLDPQVAIALVEIIKAIYRLPQDR